MAEIIDVTNILKNLKRGDINKIAEKTGLSYDYVRRVLKGERASDQVIKVAAAIAIDNQKEVGRINKLLKMIKE